MGQRTARDVGRPLVKSMVIRGLVVQSNHLALEFTAMRVRADQLLIASGYEAISRYTVFIYNIDQSCCEWRKSPPLISGGYMFNRRALIAAIALGVAIVAPPAYAQDKSIVVASTISTQDPGLFEYLLPIFKQKTGI